jgi:hypothetical protein
MEIFGLAAAGLIEPSIIMDFITPKAGMVGG